MYCWNGNRPQSETVSGAKCVYFGRFNLLPSYAYNSLTMCFKKKIYRHGQSSCPVYGASIKEVVHVDDESGVKSTTIETVVIDYADSSNYTSYPDVSKFNDLESQLKSGVPLKQVNTQVIHNDDVAEINEELGDSFETLSSTINTDTNEN